MLTRDEVIWGYRFILGRDPESETVIRQHRSHEDILQFRRTLMNSTEFGLHIGRLAESKWVATEILGGRRLIWVDLADRFVSAGCLADDYEPIETRLLSMVLREKSTFVDVGANVGWFTLLASTLVGDKGGIHAFEPRDETRHYLKRSIEINELSHIVTIHEFGLWDGCLSATLVWESGTENPGHSFVANAPLGVGYAQQPTGLKSLDSLALPAVDVIKLDVEGAEIRVLNGARDTIGRCRPAILSEVYPKQLAQVSGASAGDFFALVRALDYRALLADERAPCSELDGFPDNWHKELASVLLMPDERCTPELTKMFVEACGAGVKNQDPP